MADEDLVQVLQIEIQAKNDKIKALEKEIEIKDKKIASQTKDIDFLESRLDSAYGEVSDMERAVAVKERELSKKDGRIEILEFQLAELRRSLSSQPQPKVQTIKPIANAGNQFLWKKGPKLPKPVSAGSACTSGNKGYVYCCDGDVFEFDIKTETWSSLPPCPLKNSTIVTILEDSLPTAIGGTTDGSQETNMLASWVNSNWVCNFYPPMPTKRCRVSVVCDKKNLIVVGGCCGEEKLSVVELLHMDNEQWYMCRSLPYPLGGGSLVTAGTDFIYLVGGSARDAFQRLSILKCSMEELWKTSQRHTIHNVTMLLASKKTPANVWHKATELPLQYSTCTLIRNKIYVIGGEGTEGKQSPMIYLYNHKANRLESVGQLLEGRSWCQVMVFSRNKVVVAGGETDGGVTDEVELAEENEL